MRCAAGILLCFLGVPALGCDYPGPPPGSADATAVSGDITWAGYSDATSRYGHGILGDRIEAGGLRVQAGVHGPCDLMVILPEHSVFEDIAPRIMDLDGDGRNEVIVIETHQARGAALAIYGLRRGKLKKLTATPNIGTSHRWLSPVGAADLDGDGHTEIAYADRPHLAKTLRVWRYRNGKLTEIAARGGLSNHKIGWDHIPGGIRLCGDGPPEMILATGDWTRVVAAVLQDGRIELRDLGRFRGPKSVNAALKC